MISFDWTSLLIALLGTAVALYHMQRSQRKREDDAQRQAELMMRIARHKTEKREGLK